jgi:dTDP-glucose 4,6-dehydratase/UDP-glucose 4-epimerase
MSLRDRFVLVTGGTGFIGSALVGALLAAGARVRALDNDWRGRRDRLGRSGPGLEVLIEDIRDAAAVLRAVKGVDVVCHLAAVNGTRHFYEQPALVLEVAVKGVVNVIDACLEHGVGELAMASSSEVYQTPPLVPTDETVPLSIPDPLNPRYSYAAGKIISEMLAINYGRRHLRRVVVFRPHNVYGPDMGADHVIPELIGRIRALCRTTSGPIRVPIQGTGAETRAFTYVDDAVTGILRILERGSHLGVYNVGTEDEISIAQLAGDIAACFGRDAKVEPGLPASGATDRRVPDVGRLRALGWAPCVPIDEGLRRTVHWYNANASSEEP